MFMCAVAFADDINLLTPTFKGLKKLVSICEKYAEEYDIKFNGTNSTYMVYEGRNRVVHHADVYVNGEKVEQVTTADHLDHRLSTTDKTSMITTAVSSFWKSFYLFMTNFGCCYSVVKNKHFKQYCCFFYGAPLWSVYNYEPMCVAWRKALKIIWNVPRQTHCRLIALLSDSAPLAVQLKVRCVKFMCKALEHDNPVVKYVATVSCLNPMSVSGRNWRDCVTIQNDVSMVDMNVKNVYKEEWYDSVSVNEIDSASVVKEMIDVRDG